MVTTSTSPVDTTADERAQALLEAASLDDKLAMVHGAAVPPGVPANGYCPPNPRLGIPPLLEIGSGAGVTGDRATVLPAPIAQAATWDPDLVGRCGTVIGRETRLHGCNVAIGGNVNIARVPLNGRTFEAYGEDPLLVARLIVPHLKAIQAEGVIATVKHFALNNQESNRGGRWTYPPGSPAVDARVDERTLREIYLPAFEAAVKDAGVGVVMTSYNRANGRYAAQNDVLLNQILKDEWGFTGWTVSDWWSVHDTIDAALGGLDQEMPTGEHFGAPLKRAIEQGTVPATVLDDKVRRIWRTMARIGILDQPEPRASSADQRHHLDVAEDCATASLVLLKNDGALPLERRELRSVAVIGPDADEGALVIAGGGSSHVHPNDTDTVLGALRAQLPGVHVSHVPGTDPPRRGVAMSDRDPVPSSVLRVDGSATAEHGLQAIYYPQPDFGGEPLARRSEPYLAALWRTGRDYFNGDVSSVPPPPLGAASAVWTGMLEVPVSGRYVLELTSVEGSRLWWDDELLIDHGGMHPLASVTVALDLAAGERHAIRVEYAPRSVPLIAQVKLGWDAPDDLVPDGVQEAVEAARASDVVVVVARDLQAEASDQACLSLPNGQDQLIASVAAANPRTVVVLRTGGPVVMPWLDDVPAVLQAWYGGARVGAAIAKILLGDEVPCGKLPITFPRSVHDLPTAPERVRFPGVDGVVEYRERLHVGYRHYDAEGLDVLFPFGHGLSYTSFEHTDLRVGAAQVETGTQVVVESHVRNVGTRSGAEVVQVYLNLPLEAEEPPQRLVGFERVHLRPGEAKRVSIVIGERELSIWDASDHAWRVPAGTFTLAVGGSSRGQPLEATFEMSTEQDSETASIDSSGRTSKEDT